MRFSPPAGLCVFVACTATSVFGQSAEIQPVRATAGTVLTFYSQTRLNPVAGNALDVLSKKTALKVKLNNSVDSTVDRDGFEFRGSLVGPLMSGKEVIVRAGAEVHGLLVLLRSRSHPEGFRYELLITTITENGKAYELTASLNPSLVDGSATHAANTNPNPVPREDGKDPRATVAKAPETKN